MAIQTANPATGEVVEKFDPTAPADLERIAAAAHAAFQEWRGTPFAERSARMREAARVLRLRRSEFARTMTVEMGKPIVQGEAEVDKCAWNCEYYAEHAPASIERVAVLRRDNRTSRRWLNAAMSDS